MNYFSTKKRVNYVDYLLSVDWKMIKNQWVASGRPLECWACGKPMPSNRSGFNFHHRTYENLGHEKLDDLVLLCMYDHDQLSQEWQNMRVIKGHCLRNATHIYISHKRNQLGLSTKKDNRVMQYLGAYCE